MSTQPSTLRIGRRYRANRLNGPYDAIVIGSGIGGLTTAACLSKMGKKVAVFEQHYTAGGFTHSYDRNGYEWDVGVHYIGDVGANHTLSKRLFDYITDGKLKWAPLADNYDRLFIGDRQINLMAGPKAFSDELKRNFPGEEQAIDTYLDYLAQVAKAMPGITIGKILPEFIAGTFNRWQNKKAPSFVRKTTQEVLETLTKNQELIAALTGQWGDNGLPPNESSFIIHALIARHYLYGGYYPIGGASEMAKNIIPVIQQSGGDVFTYADVKQIIIKNGAAVGVEMADGEHIFAPAIISNAGVYNTFGPLLPDNAPSKDYYQEKLTHVRRSMASVCLYIGIKDTAENLQLPKTNLWIYPGADYAKHVSEFLASPDDHDVPLVYISFPSAKDPSFASRYPGRATIEIVAPGPFEWYSEWKDKPWGKRGDDYEAKKEAYSLRLLEKLYEKLPHLRGKIDYYELSTPLSTDYFCRYSEGEIYGLDHTPSRFEQDWLKPKTQIPGLYLTGQDIMTCGVAGAMIGGLITTVSLSGWKGLGLAKKMFVG
ncbi:MULTISPECIES: phytoene desaturase family protein [Thalassolituus]|uniref:Carotenoid cis-trans isomerase n=1 Tax=hydrothermal vent metagenome TaxID=652676 RepID=A0A160T9Z8_9ZZZZ|nr:NAD(P)/FAD-dependent oxidoreductase [Thalassolituus oleivorans]MCA6127471.1 FAD-dependent oxidoreductase [Thalassolituus oleivorans 4BN06-13]